MKKEERSYLKTKRMSEGLDEYDANKEVKDFIITQNGYKIFKREIKKKETLIKRLQDKIIKFQDRIEYYKDTIKPKNKSRLKLKKHSKLGHEILEEDLSREVMKKNKVLIKRIMVDLEYGKTYTKTDMITQLMLPTKNFEYCINHLIKIDFVGTNHVKGVLRYFKK